VRGDTDERPSTGSVVVRGKYSPFRGLEQTGPEASASGGHPCQTGDVLAKTGDVDARNRVILGSMGLGKYVLSRKGIRIKPDHGQLGDKWQSDIVFGIVAALGTYDSNKGAWSTHVVPHIWNKLFNAMRAESGPVSTRRRDGWVLPEYEYADSMDKGYDHLLDITTYQLHPDLDLDDKRELARLRAELSKLGGRELEVVHIVLSGGTLQEAGYAFGVTRERARQLYVRAITKICKNLGVDSSEARKTMFLSKNCRRGPKREKADPRVGSRNEVCGDHNSEPDRSCVGDPGTSRGARS
jgi:DNA-directed RNA polymerase specialized sigma subunit